MNAHERDPRNLLAWQWRHYSEAHRDRANLLVHALTTPVFMAGTCAVVTAWAAPGAWKLAAAAAGLAAMMGAMAAQGRTHRREEGGPAPFRGPLDVLARILAEQWITFPRYVFGGVFTRAWRAAAPRGAPGASAREARG
jgi:hypothetical protein